ncbi:hypothetical protein ACFL21_03150 [Patescibacteria group bacterium]
MDLQIVKLDYLTKKRNAKKVLRGETALLDVGKKGLALRLGREAVKLTFQNDPTELLNINSESGALDSLEMGQDKIIEWKFGLVI